MVDDRTRIETNASLALSYISVLHQYISQCDNDYEEFLENKMAQDACITQINNITQCTNRIRDHQPELYKKYFADRHQKGLTGMRKRMVHDYESVRPEFIWDFVSKDVPQLKIIFQKILSDYCSE